MKFIVDGMLGSLARKLRIYGMDVLYSSNSADADLLDKAVTAGRIMLTSDRALHERAQRLGVRCILLTEQSDRDRLVSIFRSLGLKPSSVSAASSRCPSCNGMLTVANREEIQLHLPPNIVQRHTLFYRCSSCGKIFWQGSHWKRIIAISKYVMEKLARERPSRHPR